jgi:hypothetical protein
VPSTKAFKVLHVCRLSHTPEAAADRLCPSSHTLRARYASETLKSNYCFTSKAVFGVAWVEALHNCVLSGWSYVWFTRGEHSLIPGLLSSEGRDWSLVDEVVVARNYNPLECCALGDAMCLRVHPSWVNKRAFSTAGVLVMVCDTGR